MVAIQVKVGDSEDSHFLHECSSDSTVGDVISSIATISNLQSSIQSVSLSLRPQILTQQFKDSNSEMAMVLDRTLSEAETYASKDQVVHGRALSAHVLRDHVRRIEKEVEVARSKGLIDPDVNIMQSIADNKCKDNFELLWAGRELVKEKKLSEYIGKNENTKMTVRLKPAFQDQHYTISN